MRDLSYYVYILTNQRHTVLYIGITNGLTKRFWQHTTGAGHHFAKRYNTDKLIYFEVYPEPRFAIAREKPLKRWRRSKKEELIATKNLEWRDLGEDIWGDMVPIGNATGSLDFARDDREGNAV